MIVVSGGFAMVNVSTASSIDLFAKLQSVGIVSGEGIPDGFSVVLIGLDVVRL